MIINSRIDVPNANINFSFSTLGYFLKTEFIVVVKMTSELPVVVAVDVSASTSCVPNYYSRVSKLLVNNSRVILWGDGASFTDRSQLSKYENYGHGNNTKIGDCLALLDTVPEEKFNFIIITDGEVLDASQSHRIMEKKGLKSKIQHAEIHFMGDTDRMNMEINSIFEGIPQSVYINEKQYARVQAHLDFLNLDLDEFLKDVNTAKATLITKMHALTQKDRDLLVGKFKTFEKDHLRKMAQEKTAQWKETISQLYHHRDVAKFAELAKGEAYQGSEEKKRLQSAIQACINLLTTHKQRSIYSLDHIQSIQTDLTETETEVVIEETEEDKLSELECDILYEKCQNAPRPLSPFSRKI